MAYLNLFLLTFVLVFVNGAFIQEDWQNAPESGTEIRDNILKEKFDYLQNLLQKYNVDVYGLKTKFQTASGVLPKRQVRDVSAQPAPVDPLVGIIDGILGAIASTLKSLVDSFLLTFDSNTGGLFRELLITIQNNPALHIHNSYKYSMRKLSPEFMHSLNMKPLFVLLFLTFVAEFIESAVFLEVGTIKKETKQYEAGFRCKSKQFGLMKASEEKSLHKKNMCATAICTESGIISYYGCGSAGAGFGCVVIETDLSKPHPLCCPTVKCKNVLNKENTF